MGMGRRTTQPVRRHPADSFQNPDPPPGWQLGRAGIVLLRTVFGAGFLVVCVAGHAASATETPRDKLVVVLYPGANDGSPGNLLVDRGIRDVFENAPAGKVEIHNEYLDVTRFTERAYRLDLAQFLQKKYSGRHVDLVMVGLASALDYYLEYREQIFPKAPVVFFAVDHSEIQRRSLASDIVGVPIEVDLLGSLDFALRLHPDTERVYVVIGKARYDASWEATARAVFAQRANRAEMVYLTGLPVAELLRQVGQLPPHSLIYYFHVFEDGDGKVQVPAEVAGKVATAANAPVYGHVDSYLGRGVVGGRMFSFEHQGRWAAELAMRILAGESPERLGIAPGPPSQNLVDWRQLQRWHIPERRLPPATTLRYRVPGLWETYHWHVVLAASFCLAQTALIIGLVVQRLRRNRAERQFRQAVEAAPNGMLMVASTGVILLANRHMERQFGYSDQELVGRSVEMLLPERYRSRHPTLREGFFLAPTNRAMGAGRSLFGRRKDGTEFPVEIGLSPIQSRRNRFVLVSIVDITERHLAEKTLRDSEHELRQLAGQLMGAQETERRRISRELHDDCGQNLALLSVEIDLLRQSSLDTPIEMRRRLDELSDRVKQLSSSVHDLSHQVHPLKLEQLGLVAAVRSLCHDWAEGHGVLIDFVYREIPEVLRTEVSLCLYRITQEALRNLIKHSKTEFAQVELYREGDFLHLQIADTGIGFDVAALNFRSGLGLVSMRERLRLVNGQLRIESQPGRGTQINATVPLGDPPTPTVQS